VCAGNQADEKKDKHHSPSAPQKDKPILRRQAFNQFFIPHHRQKQNPWQKIQKRLEKVLYNMPDINIPPDSRDKLAAHLPGHLLPYFLIACRMELQPA